MTKKKKKCFILKTFVLNFIFAAAMILFVLFMERFPISKPGLCTGVSKLCGCYNLTPKAWLAKEIKRSLNIVSWGGGGGDVSRLMVI